MAASESITFDFISRGADRLAGDFKKTGDSAVLASRGAKVLADAVDKLGSKENRTAEESRLLAGALRKLGDEEDKAAAKALYADAAIRRLDDAMKNTSGIDKWTNKLSSLSFLQPSGKGALLSLLPALIPVAANVGGAVAAIGVSFGAATVAAAGFGAVAGSVLSQASQDLTKLQTLNTQLASATTKSAKDKIRQQIQALEAGWTPAFKHLMGDLQDLKAAWKGTSIQIAAPALLPWLDAVKKGLGFLKPLLEPVAAIFKSWGQSIDQYFSSGKGSAEVTRLASAFGKFAALQLNDILLFLKGVGTAVFNLGRDIGASGASFYTFGTDLAGWGAAFAKWSASKKARDDVAGFIHYIHDTGPKLVGIVKDLASYIPGIFAGATTAGTLELQALSTFLGWVSKLPPSWAKPITELAGAMLLLSKTGVLKVGIQIAGAAAKLFSGGSLSLGGSTAASQIEAAFRAGGEAAAAEIRAAVTGATATTAEGAGGASAGGGLLGRIFGGKPRVLGLSFGTLLAGGVIAAVNTKLPGMHKTIWQIGDPPPPGQQKTWLNSWSGLGHAIAAIWDRVRHSLAATWDLAWNNTVGRGERGMHDISQEFDTWRHNTASIFGDIRHDIASIWDAVWNNTVGRAERGASDAARVFRNLAGSIWDALRHLPGQLWNLAKMAVENIKSGAGSVVGHVVGFFKGFAHDVVQVFRNIWGWFSPSAVMFQGGKSLMEGLEHGIKAHAHKAIAAAQIAAHQVANVGSGVQRWAPLVRQALSMEGLSPSLLGNVLYQMQTESGGNPNAINLWDANARAGDPSRGLMQVIGSTFQAYHWPGTSRNIYDPLANIAAALNYARHVYGPSLMSGGMGIGSGHGYAAGGMITEPILGVGLRSGSGYTFGERGPEMVIPGSHAGGAATVVMEIRTGGAPADALLAELLRKYIRTRGGNVQVVLGRN